MISPGPPKSRGSPSPVSPSPGGARDGACGVVAVASRVTPGGLASLISEVLKGAAALSENLSLVAS